MSEPVDFPIEEEYTASMIRDDSVEEYLADPHLDISEMIAKYDVSARDHESKKLNRNLICAVCGGRALFSNFGQISCESCKAFFRRNASKNLNETDCLLSGHCPITIDSRRYCSYCRLQKCFRVGMRKEWIKTADKEHNKRIQLEKDRSHRLVDQRGEVPNLTRSMVAFNRTVLNGTDRARLNNILHNYDQTAGDLHRLNCDRALQLREVRLDEFYNDRKPVFVNLITYFKKLPELQFLNLDDQVALIKQNIRLLIPLNFAMIRANSDFDFGSIDIRIVGGFDRVDLHGIFRSLANSFTEFVKTDIILVKLLLIVLFFAPNSITKESIRESTLYHLSHTIQQIQSSYTALLWNYLRGKYGEIDAVRLYAKMITTFLRIQWKKDQIDSIVQANRYAENIDLLMKTLLNLT